MPAQQGKTKKYLLPIYKITIYRIVCHTMVGKCPEEGGGWYGGNIFMKFPAAGDQNNNENP